MAKVKYRNFQLKQKLPNHEVVLNCWLPSAGLKIDYRVELEAYPDVWWTVVKCGTSERELDSIKTNFDKGGIIGELEKMKHSGLKISK